MAESKTKQSIKDKAFNAVKENPVGYAILALIILFFAGLAYKTYLGPTKPGAFLERTSYEKNIYVLVYPNKTDTKNYYLPGDVTRSENGYTIASVSWTDGGYSTFDDCQIYLDTRTNCTITNSKEFESVVNKMVADKSYTPGVQELLGEPDFYIQLTSNMAGR